MGNSKPKHIGYLDVILNDAYKAAYTQNCFAAHPEDRPHVILAQYIINDKNKRVLYETTQHEQDGRAERKRLRAKRIAKEQLAHKKRKARKLAREIHRLKKSEDTSIDAVGKKHTTGKLVANGLLSVLANSWKRYNRDTLDTDGHTPVTYGPQ